MKSQLLKCILLVILVSRLDARLNENNVSRELNNDDNDEDVQVFIGIKSKAITGGIFAKIFSKIVSRFDNANVMSAVVKRSDFSSLQNDPNVDFIEEDPMVYPDGELDLYGMRMIQATSQLTTTVSTLQSSSACSDPSSFKIGIIDSGLAWNHPDINCIDITSTNTNCIGSEFGLLSRDGRWFNPVARYHGTHVAGTIGATALNNDGLSGVLNNEKFCYIIGRVFGESEESSRMSSVLQAIQWMVSKGVNVINMSLGSPDYLRAGEAIVKDAFSKGVILVASAGNSGSSTLQYPASYQHVVSVAAVDANRTRASFSQYNSYVDLSAPGVDILSTYPMNLGGVVFMSTSTVAVTGAYIKYSIQRDVTGTLVNCPNFGQAKCPGPGKHLCLIQRGVNTFEQKTLNCQLGGGVGAIIYNNAPGKMNAGLSSSTQTKIPAFDLTQEDGKILETQPIKSTLVVAFKKGYSYLSGTSMASPHVAGVAALIWRRCRACTNTQVIQCMFETAADLGIKGRDVYYGSGLVQAQQSFLCLAKKLKCCVTNN